MIPITEELAEGAHAEIQKVLRRSANSKLAWWASTLRLKTNLEFCEARAVRSPVTAGKIPAISSHKSLL